MTTVIEREAIERAERIRENIYRSNGSSRNGSSPEVKTEIVMNEWLEACNKIRESLYVLRKPWDKRRPAEDELDNILFVIETAFSFDWGSAPNELGCRLCEGDDKRHMETCENLMLWNYPEFAKTVCERAKKLNITTQKLIARALDLLRDGGENVRQRVLEQLFGEEQSLIGIAGRKNI